jgi:hypothetical protein
MTKTFERFLRSFTDDELAAFVQDRAEARPPYWKTMQLALRIEASRRGLLLDNAALGLSRPADSESERRTVTA